jgi:hypothetical protein
MTDAKLQDDLKNTEEPEWHILQPIEVKNTDPDVVQPCPDAEIINVSKPPVVGK